MASQEGTPNSSALYHALGGIGAIILMIVMLSPLIQKSGARKATVKKHQSAGDGGTPVASESSALRGSTSNNLTKTKSDLLAEELIAEEERSKVKSIKKKSSLNVGRAARCGSPSRLSPVVLTEPSSRAAGPEEDVGDLLLLSELTGARAKAATPATATAKVGKLEKKKSGNLSSKPPVDPSAAPIDTTIAVASSGSIESPSPTTPKAEHFATRSITMISSPEPSPAQPVASPSTPIAHSDIDSLRDQLGSLRQKLRNLEQELAKRTEKESASARTVSVLKNERDELCTEVMILQETLKKVNDQVTGLKDTNVLITQSLFKEQQNVREATAKLAEKNSAKELERIKVLEAEKEYLSAKNKDITEKSDKLAADVRSLQSFVNMYELQLKQSNEQLAQSNKKIAAFEREALAFTTSQTSLNEQVSALKQENSSLNNMLIAKDVERSQVASKHQNGSVTSRTDTVSNQKNEAYDSLLRHALASQTILTKTRTTLQKYMKIAMTPEELDTLVKDLKFTVKELSGKLAGKAGASQPAAVAAPKYVAVPAAGEHVKIECMKTIHELEFAKSSIRSYQKSTVQLRSELKQLYDQLLKQSEELEFSRNSVRNLENVVKTLREGSRTLAPFSSDAQLLKKLKDLETKLEAERNRVKVLHSEVSSGKNVTAEICDSDDVNELKKQLETARAAMISERSKSKTFAEEAVMARLAANEIGLALSLVSGSGISAVSSQNSEGAQKAADAKVAKAEAAVKEALAKASQAEENATIAESKLAKAQGEFHESLSKASRQATEKIDTLAARLQNAESHLKDAKFNAVDLTVKLNASEAKVREAEGLAKRLKAAEAQVILLGTEAALAQEAAHNIGVALEQSVLDRAVSPVGVALISRSDETVKNLTKKVAELEAKAAASCTLTEKLKAADARVKELGKEAAQAREAASLIGVALEFANVGHAAPVIPATLSAPKDTGLDTIVQELTAKLADAEARVKQAYLAESRALTASNEMAKTLASASNSNACASAPAPSADGEKLKAELGELKKRLHKESVRAHMAVDAAVSYATYAVTAERYGEAKPEKKEPVATTISNGVSDVALAEVPVGVSMDDLKTIRDESNAARLRLMKLSEEAKEIKQLAVKVLSDKNEKKIDDDMSHVGAGKAPLVSAPSPRPSPLPHYVAIIKERKSADPREGKPATGDAKLLFSEKNTPSGEKKANGTDGPSPSATPESSAAGVASLKKDEPPKAAVKADAASTPKTETVLGKKRKGKTSSAASTAASTPESSLAQPSVGLKIREANGSSDHKPLASVSKSKSAPAANGSPEAPKESKSVTSTPQPKRASAASTPKTAVKPADIGEETHVTSTSKKNKKKKKKAGLVAAVPGGSDSSLPGSPTDSDAYSTPGLHVSIAANVGAVSQTSTPVAIVSMAASTPRVHDHDGTPIAVDDDGGDDDDGNWTTVTNQSKKKIQQGRSGGPRKRPKSTTSSPFMPWSGQN
ncbi:hypothetical protein BJ742DRAFT_807649 [Cladochytrium replicatum]|nr:hypothetical protein BJ742DRAFT_807649 [Cladochytrium replicatum]